MSMDLTPYTINPTITQDSITQKLRDSYSHVPIIPDGMVTADTYLFGGYETPINYHLDGSIKPFIVLWFSSVKRSRRGRSFGNMKLDSRYGSVDVVVVANNPTDCRLLLNDVSDTLVEFQTAYGGKMVESSSLWGQARSIDIANRPTRYAATNRFDFGVAARKIAP